MKLFKKNQVIIYVIALMLMTAGYLNYTTNQDNSSSVETSMQMESKDDMQLADIGDATLVSSNDIVSSNSTTNTTNTTDVSNSTNSNEVNKNNAVENVSGNTNSVSNQSTLPTEQESTGDKTIQTNYSTSNDYFVKSKLDRDTMYSQMIETYEKVLNSTNSLETQKQTATQEITKINEIKNKIMICENLIKTKGFENSIIFVNGESISIIIGANDMKQEEVAQIQNIISREMGAAIENIHISTK